MLTFAKVQKTLFKAVSKWVSVPQSVNYVCKVCTGILNDFGFRGLRACDITITVKLRQTHLVI
jgi:hypothetical protein